MYNSIYVTPISNPELAVNLVPSVSNGVYTNAMLINPMDAFAIQVNYSNATPSAVVFASTAVNTSTNVITAPAHGLATGVLGQFTTTGSLPTGLSTSTNYWIIFVDVDHFKVASSLANASAGTAVVLSAQGSGNDTFTPTASSGNVFKVQGSNDGTNWSDLSGASVTIATSTGSSLFNASAQAYRYLGFNYASSAGAINLTVIVNGISNVGVS